ncbi:hypothetical protein MPTK1_1g09950 [Marchantia polymorpha subsp. ruderalis]|uniref:Secreted protein n=2 Tax=Marchantia polymorpha TaxID=3197 RepID=A0AAF6ANG6_MARPO|nr:hypothetical protein MARPO_0096s0006 [Marchantia polymorpha]BBM97986.1 hypothetical protein Mp_1g09950 [Marchantia polymorpha subsp. ruderalis]|eukprot:PTQ32644.1 hypothetical protein MARPO_0096s0006 [Marchantia polymorpha]
MLAVSPLLVTTTLFLSSVCLIAAIATRHTNEVLGLLRGKWSRRRHDIIMRSLHCLSYGRSPLLEYFLNTSPHIPVEISLRRQDVDILQHSMSVRRPEKVNLAAGLAHSPFGLQMRCDVKSAP